jgi:hypothetical protein
MIPLVFDIDFIGLLHSKPIRGFGVGTVSAASYLTSNEAFQGFRRTMDGQNISASQPPIVFENAKSTRLAQGPTCAHHPSTATIFSLISESKCARRYPYELGMADTEYSKMKEQLEDDR